MQWKIPLTDPDLGSDEIAAVTRVLESKWLTMGGVTAEFEKQFAAKMNVKHAFAVTNCTAALHLANLALGIGPGDEVICPDLTFVATANAVRYTGAEVALADIVSQSELTISPTDIEAKITDKTKAITVVHYAGFPCLMDEIMALARKHNLKVIEDCAHAPFAWHSFEDGSRQFVGAIGDIGCFSFFSNKNMTTGEGGMITTNDDEIADKLRLLRSHGMTTLTYERHKGHASGYDVVALGYNYRIDEIRSAIGLCQLGKIDRFNDERRKVYQWYLEAFEDVDHVFAPFAERDLSASTCHIMPVLIRRGYDQIKAQMQEARVQTSKHYAPISSFTLYKNQVAGAQSDVADGLMTLPLGPAMTREEVAFVVEQCRI